MKKRTLISVMMAFVMVCLAGCGSKSLTAEEVLAKATEKQQAAKSIDASMKMDISMDIAGQSIDYDMDVDMKAIDMNEEGMQMSMQTDMDILGQQMSMNTYYTDGCYYMDSMGQKMKMNMDIAEMTETLKQNSVFTEIPADAYKSLEVEEKDGGRMLTYTADGSQLTEIVDSIMSGMMGSLGEMDDMDVGLGDVSGTITLDKDFNVTAQTMKMDMTMTVEGMDVGASMDMDMTVNNPGQEVTVELPDDLDSYEEMEE